MTGVFGPPKHRWLAKIVCIKTVTCAKRAVRELLYRFKKALRAGKRQLAVTIKRATVLAATRARLSAKRRNISRKEKRELLAVSRMYRAAAEKMVLPKRKRRR